MGLSCNLKTSDEPWSETPVVCPVVCPGGGFARKSNINESYA
uniref:Uncharacterized protein n=1 Tax=Arundo donax TaxID=35708 RepID=A0A0A9D076_ARUDO